MSERKINLEEIFNNNFDCYTNFEDKGNYNDEPAISKDKFKELCLEFGKQLLELAAENTCLTEECYGKKYKEYIITVFNEYNEIEKQIYVNKQSILDTIKQVE